MYPARSPSDTWVPKMDLPGRSREGEEAVEEGRGGGGVGALHFVLVDGTWTNSKALVNRLQVAPKLETRNCAPLACSPRVR